MADELIFDSLTICNFWLKVARKDPSECWVWLGAGKGHRGRFAVQRRLQMATHVALILDGKPRPSKDHFALHSDHCISTECVNPNHLRWGTHDENMDDMSRLGRQAKGITQWKSVLTEDNVREIRRSTESARHMAVRFGVAQSTIHRIRNRFLWKHVE